MKPLNKDQGSSKSLADSKGKLTQDTFFKMSKKIAQLTKVIHFLHSKQDDHSIQVDSLKEAYEHEIDLIVDSWKERAELFESESAQKEDQVVALTETLVRKDDQIEKLQKELEDLKRYSNYLFLFSLDLMIRHTEEKSKGHAETIQALSMSVSDLTTSLTEKETHIESSTTAYSSQIAHLKDDIARLTKEREEYIQKLSEEHQEEVSVLKRSLEHDVSLPRFF